MQFIKQLHTEDGQKRFRADMSKATDDIVADIRAKKKAGEKPMKQRPWQYTNSNFGMGI